MTTADIAHAYGVTEQTMAVRISRAKQQIQKSGARFEFTVNDDFSGRPSTVMRILYLIFNEGYTVTTGSKLTRTDLTGEAIRLTRLLHALVPDDPEPAGLLALMLLTDSCRATRTTENGDLIPLADQDRTRWDHNYPRRIGTDPHRMVTRERTAYRPPSPPFMHPLLSPRRPTGNRSLRSTWRSNKSSPAGSSCSHESLPLPTPSALLAPTSCLSN